MLELSHSQISHKRSSVSQQNHTPEMKLQRDGREEMRDGDVVPLWENWFFMYLNFHPRLNFLFIFLNLCSTSCLSPFSLFHFKPLPPPSFFFSPPFLDLSLFSPLFPAVGQHIFNFVSQTSLKARSSKEKFDVLFHSVICSGQLMARWFTINQTSSRAAPSSLAGDLAGWNKWHDLLLANGSSEFTSQKKLSLLTEWLVYIHTTISALMNKMKVYFNVK